MMVSLPFIFLILNRIQCLSNSLEPIYYITASTKFILEGLLVDSLRGRVSFPFSFLDVRGLVKLGRLSGKYIILCTKLAVYWIMGLVEDRTTDAKREMRPKTPGLPYVFLSISYILLLFLITEMRRFKDYGIQQEDCKGIVCSSPIGESSFAASRLTSVGFCTLLKWLNWWFCPRVVPYPDENIISVFTC